MATYERPADWHPNITGKIEGVLNEIVEGKGIYPRITCMYFHPYSSFVTKTAMPGSDIDMLVIVYDEESLKEKMDVVEKRLKKRLQSIEVSLEESDINWFSLQDIISATQSVKLDREKLSLIDSLDDEDDNKVHKAATNPLVDKLILVARYEGAHRIYGELPQEAFLNNDALKSYVRVSYEGEKELKDDKKTEARKRLFSNWDKLTKEQKNAIYILHYGQGRFVERSSLKISDEALDSLKNKNLIRYRERLYVEGATEVRDLELLKSIEKGTGRKLPQEGKYFEDAIEILWKRKQIL